MRTKEQEKARQHALYIKRRAAILAGVYMKDDEILDALQSGIRKIAEKVLAEGYTLTELAEILNTLDGVKS